MSPCGAAICSWRCSICRVRRVGAAFAAFQMSPNCPGRGRDGRRVCRFLSFAKSPNSPAPHAVKTGIRRPFVVGKMAAAQMEAGVSVGLEAKRSERTLNQTDKSLWGYNPHLKASPEVDVT